jgi:quercetin dioxygenase-like cupin family protein
MSSDKDLRTLSRYITTHTPSGLAIFSTAIPEEAPVTRLGSDTMDFSLMYTTSSQPANMNSDGDISSYGAHIATPPEITIPGGSVGRVVDFAPGYTSAMHRTVSIDFGIVIEGEVELILDSGETRLLERGDVAVQRGTNHAWRNVSSNRWARMFYVLQDARPIVLDGGKEMAEDFGGIHEKK